MMRKWERTERLRILEIVLTSPVLVQLAVTPNRFAAPGAPALDINVDTALEVSGRIWTGFDARMKEIDAARNAEVMHRLTSDEIGDDAR